MKSNVWILRKDVTLVGFLKISLYLSGFLSLSLSVPFPLSFTHFSKIWYGWLDEQHNTPWQNSIFPMPEFVPRVITGNIKNIYEFSKASTSHVTSIFSFHNNDPIRLFYQSHSLSLAIICLPETLSFPSFWSSYKNAIVHSLYSLF